jgi:hypothetical protein
VVLEDVLEESEEEPEVLPEPVPKVVLGEVPTEGAMIAMHTTTPSHPMAHLRCPRRLPA